MSELIHNCEHPGCSRKYSDYERSLSIDNKCVFHTDKESWYEKDEIGLLNWHENKIVHFWSEIRKYMNDVDKLEAGTLSDSIPYYNSLILKRYIFKDFIFPKFDKSSAAISEKEKNFFDLKETSFKKDVDFSHAIFMDKADFIGVEFNGEVYFSECKFLDDVDMSRTTFNKDLLFTNVILEHYEIDFSFSHFKGNISFSIKKSPNDLSVNFQECEFDSFTNFTNLLTMKLLLKNSIFEDHCDFTDMIIIDELNLENATFQDNVTFDNSNFDGVSKFEYTTFYSNVSFYNTSIRDLNLETTTFLGNTNFLNINNEVDESEKSFSIFNRETARIIKDSFEKQNNIIEANRFYKLEMIEREKELEQDRKNGENLLEWFVVKIHGLSSNHSQNWFLAFIWIMIFGLYSSFYEMWIKSKFAQENNDVFIGILIFGFSCYYFYLLLQNRRFNCYIGLITFWVVSYGFYSLISKDIYLTEFAKNLNPFSIMKNGEDITFIGLLFKIIMAYLIYQFIVSVRQNTRRK